MLRFLPTEQEFLVSCTSVMQEFTRTKPEHRACRDLFNNIKGPAAVFKVHQFIDNSKILSTLLLLTANQNKK